MKRFINKARKIRRDQKGFTLIELLVVMAILAILVGLVLPNFFGMTYEAEATMIAGQHEKLREAVFLYYIDTGQFPTEWSGAPLGQHHLHQLWRNRNDADTGTVPGWDGPYIERVIEAENRWGGFWGVYENRHLSGAAGGRYTVLLYANVPREVCEILDEMIDDGSRTGGIVRYYGTYWGSGGEDDDNFLSIMIARQP